MTTGQLLDRIQNLDLLISLAMADITSDEDLALHDICWDANDCADQLQEYLDEIETLLQEDLK